MKKIKNLQLYTDHNLCLEKLKKDTVFEECTDKNITDKYIYHTYWHGEFGAKQALSVKSVLATQNLENSELWVWLDSQNGYENYATNPYLKPLLPLIKVKKFDPVEIAKNTPYFDGYLSKLFFSKKWNSLLAQTDDLPLRADIFRILVLYTFGGFYFDLDVILLKDWTGLLSNIAYNEFCYQWAEQPYGNSAILYLNKKSEIARHLLINGRNKNSYQPWVIFKDDNKNIDSMYLLPVSFFDPLFVIGKIDSKDSVHFNFFEKQEHKNISSISLTTFFPGCYAYHWHNQWKHEEYIDSVAGKLNEEIDSVISAKYSVIPYPSFLS